MDKLPNYLIFGATGAIGASTAEKLQLGGNVTRGSRHLQELEHQVDLISRFDGVVWAQGINATDSSASFELNVFEEVIDANVIFVLRSLKVLLNAGKIQKGSQLVVLSSVWGQLTRPNKLSYGVSKAAIGGVVRSLAADLGPLGIQVNAVSPGPIDTPMTIRNMKPEELERVISESPLKRLVNITEVASVVCELASGKLSGVTGQEIIVDSGWSVSKLV